MIDEEVDEEKQFEGLASQTIKIELKGILIEPHMGEIMTILIFILNFMTSMIMKRVMMMKSPGASQCVCSYNN